MPMLIARSPVVGWIEGQLSARTGCSVRVGSLSLGWFSPITAYDTEVRDARGQPLLTAASVESQRTLLGLLLHRDSPGGLRIEGASFAVVFAGGATNLQQALAQMIDAPPEDRAPRGDHISLPPMEVEIADSSIQLTDHCSGETWHLSSVQATVRLFHDDALPVQARVVAAIAAGGTAGSIEASVTLREEDGAWKQGECKARLHNIPLETVAPLLRRAVPGLQLHGGGQGQFLITWGIARRSVTDLTVDGEMTARGCSVQVPGLEESLVLDHVRAPCKLRYDGTRLDVARSEVVCDLGQMRFAGSIDLQAPGLAWLDCPGQEVSATLDLVRLADRLPKTLHIHPDLRLTSGLVRLEAKSAANEENGWNARLTVTNITGVRGNQPIIWQEPVILDARARQLGGGVPLIEEIHCASGFLQLDGTTTTQGFRFQGDADLGKLADPLSRFVDLGSARLAGQVHGEVTVRSLPDKRFIAWGSGKVSDLYIEWTKGRPLEEDLVNVQLRAEGQIRPDGVQRVDAARVTLGFGTDVVQSDLAEPLPDLSESDWGVWQIDLKGDLARWQRRARPSVLALDRWQLAGSMHVQGQVRHGYGGLECPALAIAVRDFQCTGPGLRIDEPTLYLHTAAGFDSALTLRLRDVQLRCASVSATAEHLHWHPESAQLRGAIKLRGDLGRLQHWFHGVQGKFTDQLAGDIDGHVDLQPDGEALNVGFQLAVKDFAWADSAVPAGREAALHEPVLRCAGKGRLEPAQDRLALGPVHLKSSLGSLELQAKVDRLTESCDLEVIGEVSYDLAHLEPVLHAALGIDVHIAGKETHSFTVAGPLCPALPAEGLSVRLLPRRVADAPLQLRELRGDGTFGWQSLHALGCTVGPAEARLYLQRSWLQVYPLEATLNGGRLRLQPNLRLDPAPAELILGPGLLIEKARITPELCAGALGYAMPALGHVAQAEGTISVTLESGRIPLDDLKRTELKGKIVFDDAQFGPGALARELGAVFKIAPPPCRVAPADIPFHLANGRIYHRDLELVFAEGTLRSSGSVGLDGSLGLLIEMPIPPALIASANLPSSLAKQMLRLPVGGTIDQPRIEPRALQAATNQILREVAGEALQQRLKSLLDKQ
jgi:hypothetical protein